MTYEEAVESASVKLSDWYASFDDDFHSYEKIDPKSGNSSIFEVNNPKGCYESDGLLSMTFIPFDTAIATTIATNLEDFFTDPLKATKEEVGLFKLEYGFDYPRELTCDL